MALYRTFLTLFLCFGLIYQGSATAAAMPQTEPMLASDCAQMMHHSEKGEAAHHHGDDTDAPCENMSVDCLLAMNAVSAVWVDGPVYLSNITSPLLSRASAPDYPPPRI